jgi:hypothetical protein
MLALSIIDLFWAQSVTIVLVPVLIKLALISIVTYFIYKFVRKTFKATPEINI